MRFRFLTTSFRKCRGLTIARVRLLGNLRNRSVFFVGSCVSGSAQCGIEGAAHLRVRDVDPFELGTDQWFCCSFGVLGD